MRRGRPRQRPGQTDGGREFRRPDAGAGREACDRADDAREYGPMDRVRRPARDAPGAGGEWARDDDGDGVREVHCNTLEALWTGLRNFLRPFRGVHKKYLYRYVAMFEWSCNCQASDDTVHPRLAGHRSSPHQIPFMSRLFWR